MTFFRYYSCQSDASCNHHITNHPITNPANFQASKIYLVMWELQQRFLFGIYTICDMILHELWQSLLSRLYTSATILSVRPKPIHQSAPVSLCIEVTVFSCGNIASIPRYCNSITVFVPEGYTAALRLSCNSALVRSSMSTTIDLSGAVPVVVITHLLRKALSVSGTNNGILSDDDEHRVALCHCRFATICSQQLPHRSRQRHLSSSSSFGLVVVLLSRNASAVP